MRPSLGYAIDCANPINRNHWSAKGLLSYLQVIPGLSGGAVIHDLMSLPGDLKSGNSGILTGTIKPIWQQTSRPGGLGHLLLNGSNYIKIPDNLPKGGAPRSFAIWFRTSTVSTIQAFLDYGNVTNSTTHTRNLFYITAVDRLVYDVFGASVTSPISVVDGKWHLAMAIYSGSIMSLYLDGAIQGSTPANIGTVANAAYISTAGDGVGTNGMRGPIDSFRAWSRAFSPIEVKELYNLDSRGSLGLFNLSGLDVYSIPLQNRYTSSLLMAI